MMNGMLVVDGLLILCEIIGVMKWGDNLLWFDFGLQGVMILIMSHENSLSVLVSVFLFFVVLCCGFSVLPSISNEVMKSVVAQFTASQLITQREQVSRVCYSIHPCFSVCDRAECPLVVFYTHTLSQLSSVSTPALFPHSLFAVVWLREPVILTWSCLMFLWLISPSPASTPTLLRASKLLNRRLRELVSLVCLAMFVDLVVREV